MGKSKQNIKQFKGILEGVEYRKTKLLNMRGASSRQVRSTLKKDGIRFHGLKKVEIIHLFCDKFRIEDRPKSRKLSDRWLVEKWLDKDFHFLGCVNDRNYSNSEWNALKKKVFKFYGKVCMWCRSEENISCDHIKPYVNYPELSLEFDNMQVLCRSCNSKKGVKIIDFRNPIVRNK